MPKVGHRVTVVPVATTSDRSKAVMRPGLADRAGAGSGACHQQVGPQLLSPLEANGEQHQDQSAIRTRRGVQPT